MSTSARFSADGESIFQVLWEDGDRVFCRAWRQGADGSRHAVLPAAGHPTPATLDRLVHEYGLKDTLDGAWAAHPLECQIASNRDPFFASNVDPLGVSLLIARR